MKVFEVLKEESDEWENAGYSNRSSEIAFLQGKRKAIAHQQKLNYIKIMRLAEKDIIVDDPSWTTLQGEKFIAIPGTGVRETNFKRYFAAPNQPEVAKFVRDMNSLAAKDKEYVMRIKDLTVKNHTFVFTGFRDASMEQRITALGGRVTTSVSSKTNYVVAADPSDQTGKVLKARQLDVRILSKNQLRDILRD